MNPEKLKLLQAQVRTGGKGSVRRKFKAPHRQGSSDEKKVQAELKRLGLQQWAGIDEANLFKEDDTVIHFSKPKLQTSYHSRIFAISGPNTVKPLSEMGDGIWMQLGAERFAHLAQKLHARGTAAGILPPELSRLAGVAGAAGGAARADDEGIPDLVAADFQANAEKGKAGDNKAAAEAGAAKPADGAAKPATDSKA